VARLDSSDPHLRTYPSGSRRTFFRPCVLLRRGVPVPGILATHRPGRLWISLVASLLPDIQFGDDRIKHELKQ
jgi:hypothetical protein